MHRGEAIPENMKEPLQSALTDVREAKQSVKVQTKGRMNLDAKYPDLDPPGNGQSTVPVKPQKLQRLQF
jgi:hypothetical protein